MDNITSVQINTLEDVRRFTQGTRKHILTYTLREVIGLLENGSIVVAPFNRNEVSAREGNSDELLLSISAGLSIGIFLGYCDTVVPRSGKITASPDTPIKITEGGHRSRWIRRIASGDATLYGKTLAALATENVALYNDIMDYQVVFNITTHTSGTVPESYMKFEYQRINTLTSTLKPGEVLRASENDEHMTLVEKFRENIIVKHKFADNRESATTAAAAIVNGLLHGVESITSKDKEILDKAKEVPEPEQVAKAHRLIDAYTSLEKDVLDMYPDVDVADNASKDAKKHAKDMNKAAAALRKQFTGRGFNIAFDGVLIAAMINAAGPVELADVCNDIKKFYKLSLVSNDVWKINSVRVMQPGPNNSARNYTVRRFQHGWGQLQSIVNPQAVIVDAPSGEARSV